MAFKLNRVKSKGGCQFQQEGAEQIRSQESSLSLSESSLSLFVFDLVDFQMLYHSLDA